MTPAVCAGDHSPSGGRHQSVAPADAAALSSAAGDAVSAQHARIVACLKARGRLSRRELEAACDVPSVTKRVCELIALGWPIKRTRGHELTRQGGRRRATFYTLNGAHAQGDLFDLA